MAPGMERFRARLEAEVLTHPIIVENPYTAWFKRGDISREQARAFLVQFSVFSNEFLVAQLRKMLNAESVDEMRASKEILANEIGVGFRGRTKSGDAELGSETGSIEGGTFHFKAAHFELLTRMAGQLGLGFEELGRRRFGTEPTVRFCDSLIRLYGQENYAVAEAASWAVENWAAAGFWDELVEGWRRFKGKQNHSLNITFFVWHARVEANHAQHTWDELAAYYASHGGIDEDGFVRTAIETLDEIHAFWQGLDQQRQNLVASEPEAVHLAS